MSRARRAAAAAFEPPRVALAAAQLKGVDLHEPHSAPVRQPERVAVGDRGDDVAIGGRRPDARKCERGETEQDQDETLHVDRIGRGGRAARAKRPISWAHTDQRASNSRCFAVGSPTRGRGSRASPVRSRGRARLESGASRARARRGEQVDGKRLPENEEVHDLDRVAVAACDVRLTAFREHVGVAAAQGRSCSVTPGAPPRRGRVRRSRPRVRGSRRSRSGRRPSGTQRFGRDAVDHPGRGDQDVGVGQCLLEHRDSIAVHVRLEGGHRVDLDDRDAAAGARAARAGPCRPSRSRRCRTRGPGR